MGIRVAGKQARKSTPSLVLPTRSRPGPTPSPPRDLVSSCRPSFPDVSGEESEARCSFSVGVDQGPVEGSAEGRKGDRGALRSVPRFICQEVRTQLGRGRPVSPDRMDLYRAFLGRKGADFRGSARGSRRECAELLGVFFIDPGFLKAESTSP